MEEYQVRSSCPGGGGGRPPSVLPPREAGGGEGAVLLAVLLHLLPADHPPRLALSHLPAPPGHSLLLSLSLSPQALTARLLPHKPLRARLLSGSLQTSTLLNKSPTLSWAVTATNISVLLGLQCLQERLLVHHSLCFRRLRGILPSR